MFPIASCSPSLRLSRHCSISCRLSTSRNAATKIQLWSRETKMANVCPFLFQRGLGLESTHQACITIVSHLCRPGIWSISPILARYWTNPHQFNPSRFLGDWPRKAFLPFSSGKALGCRLSNTTLIQFTQGPRACLGRKSVISGHIWLKLTYPTWFKGSPKQKS